MGCGRRTATRSSYQRRVLRLTPLDLKQLKPEDLARLRLTRRRQLDVVAQARQVGAAGRVAAVSRHVALKKGMKASLDFAGRGLGDAQWLVSERPIELGDKRARQLTESIGA